MNFTLDDEFMTSVHVTDNKTTGTQSPLGIASLPNGATFTYSLDKVATEVCVSYTNTAVITETLQQDSVTVQICGDYWAFTPGFWKNHTPTEPSGHNAWQYTAYTPLTRWVLCLALTNLRNKPKGSSKTFSQYTLQEALSFKGGSGVQGATQILLRAGVAALLNASFHETLDVDEHPAANPNQDPLVNPVTGQVYYPLQLADDY